jgi:hypothetical protein
MLRATLVAITLTMMLACAWASDPLPTGAPDTLLLIDSTEHTASYGHNHLTASSTSGSISTPGGQLPGVGLRLKVSQSPIDSTKWLLSCIDIRLYAQFNGTIAAYSRNQAKNVQCSAIDSRASGPNGEVREIIALSGLAFSDIQALPPGTYYARYSVTFPDSSVGEVRVATVIRF